MTDADGVMLDISADRPLERPEQDLLGYAPFAKQLADSICLLRGLEGLVIALHGPWGSGKTTLLNLVRHYIASHTEEEQPVIVLFNPWWFSGQESIANAFLEQLQAVLPGKGAKLRKIGSLIGKYADSIATTADMFGYGVLGRAATLFKKSPKDASELKKQIADTLRQHGKHILVIVDDIDRLTPDDLRQLFKVIKALADFPNVVYLLAFDKQVAVKALSVDSGVSGEDYLKKIVQVPFQLPVVDRTSLRNTLFRKLGQVLAETPDDLFDSTYWGNIYHQGIDSLIEVPRDIVRLINTLSVTYRAVRGEVNPVDFIAIESVRVFVPDLYDAVRANPDAFTGHFGDLNDTERSRVRAFHDAWMNRVPDTIRGAMKDLMMRLFPGLQSVWNNTSFGADSEANWRRHLRICSSAIFPVYFRFAVPEGAVSRADLEAALQAADSTEELKSLLRAASLVTRPDGTSKCSALLERLQDLTDEGIPNAKTKVFVTALLQVGDELLVPQDENRGMFGFGNESRVARLIYRLLKREQAQARCQLLTECFAGATALGVCGYLLRALHGEFEKNKAGEEESLVDEACLRDLRAAFVSLVEAASRGGSLVTSPRLPQVLLLWSEWGQSDDVRAWASGVTQSDEDLRRFVTKFVQRPVSHGFGDVVGRIGIRLNPAWLSPYIDTDEVAARIEAVLQYEVVDPEEKLALEQFAQEYAMIKAGKNPDAPFAFDED